MIRDMDNKYVKSKVKELLRRIPGNKGAKNTVLGAMLHLSPRQIINLRDGKCKADWHLQQAIEKILTE